MPHRPNKPQIIYKDGKETCGAKTRGGGLCEQTIIDADNGRCYLHGGTSLRGVEHPRHKGAGYSTVLKGDFLADFEEYIKRTDFLETQEEGALLYARIKELKERADSGITPEKWNLICEIVLSPLEEEESPKNRLDQLAIICESTIDDSGIWHEIVKTTGELRKLKETKRKVERDSSAMITKVRALAILETYGASMRDALEKIIPERETVTKILTEAQVNFQMANGRSTAIARRLED